MFLPSYWKAPDGTILSEEKMLPRLCAPGIHVLDCYYGGQDQRLLNRIRSESGKAIRMMTYESLTQMLVSVILSDINNSTARFIADLDTPDEILSVTSMEFIQGKDSTALILARAANALCADRSVILTGNQLTDLAGNLLEQLNEPEYFSVCR